jgi:hypothetical protein
VLNQIKLCFPIDINTNLKEEVEFLTGCSQTLLNSLKQRTDACGESNTFFRSKISELKKSMKIIGNKNVELQDTINSLRKAARIGGANFSSSLLELKEMQENFLTCKLSWKPILHRSFLNLEVSMVSRDMFLYSNPPPPPCALLRGLMFVFLV